jgi:DNA adenine methylase
LQIADSRLKPPLKWAGGKPWLVPHLETIWRPHRDLRLVEPFCGGLAVALGLDPREALLNDVNPHLMNFYGWLRRGLRPSVPMLNSKETFYENRERFNRLLEEEQQESAEAAALFYYLNRTGYNGLCRFNQSGKFNVPFGRYRSITYVSDFTRYETAFRAWEFAEEDFERLELRDTDFVYADPPYDVPFTQYSRGGFGWEDQVRAAEWLSKHNGPVVLSNQATDRVVKLYEQLGYRVEFVQGPRMISCTGERTRAREVLATRNLEARFAPNPEP